MNPQTINILLKKLKTNSKNTEEDFAQTMQVKECQHRGKHL